MRQEIAFGWLWGSAKCQNNACHAVISKLAKGVPDQITNSLPFEVSIVAARSQEKIWINPKNDADRLLSKSCLDRW